MSSTSTARSTISAAGIVAIIGGSISLLVAAIAIFFLAGPYVFFSLQLGAVIFLLLVLGVLGLVTGVGLLRLRPWARTSALVSAVVVAVLSVAQFLWVVMNRPPGPTGLGLVLWFIPFDAVPVGISLWWLILFSRKETAAVFAGSVGSEVPERELEPPESDEPSTT